MTDIFDAQKRSEVMSKIRGKNTKAEIIVFRYLRANKVYFQKHYKRAPGSPDIAIPRKKKAVFIDGDFWHGRTLGRLIERRGDDKDDYWIQKIKRNMERDKVQESELLKCSWTYVRICDSDIIRKKTREAELCRITKFLLHGA